MKNAVVENYHVSIAFNAPIEFVFDWCTDFREDDGKMTGSKAIRHFLERTKERVIWIVNYDEAGKPKEGLRVVWLTRPRSWHLDTCGDHREVGDYKLAPAGKNKTRLEMTFQFTYDDPEEVIDKDVWENETLEQWQIYSRYLEKDYKASVGRR